MVHIILVHVRTFGSTVRVRSDNCLTTDAVAFRSSILVSIHLPKTLQLASHTWDMLHMICCISRYNFLGSISPRMRSNYIYLFVLSKLTLLISKIWSVLRLNQPVKRYNRLKSQIEVSFSGLLQY